LLGLFEKVVIGLHVGSLKLCCVVDYSTIILAHLFKMSDFSFVCLSFIRL